MTDQSWLKIIEDNPIGKGLDAFRASLNPICKDRGISCSSDALGQPCQDDLQNLYIDLLLALQGLGDSRLLPSSGSGKNLLSGLSRLNSVVSSDDFDFDCIKPFLNAALAVNPDDALMWDQVYTAVTESIPPPRPIASSFQQTAWLYNTSSFANSSEYHQDVDNVLKLELGPLYIGLVISAKQFLEAWWILRQHPRLSLICAWKVAIHSFHFASNILASQTVSSSAGPSFNCDVFLRTLLRIWLALWL